MHPSAPNAWLDVRDGHVCGDKDSIMSSLSPHAQSHSQTGPCDLIANATHNWQDRLFFDSDEHKIIAVIDHDARYFAQEKHLQRRRLLGFALAGSVACLMWLPGLTWLMGFNLLFGIFKCRTTLPHTAVTLEGLVHVDEYRFKHIFPLDDILEVTVGLNGNFGIKLAKDVPYYAIPRLPSLLIRGIGKIREFNLNNVKEPELLRALIDAQRRL
ncbi:hypothetical protein MPSEU_000185500 [Mayamaea pseudoterrestris]|nr:hypothetical protein MPSEU_000185500 [Mayamaea pseudoterrestris]